jgi:outer membrane lipoprotein-sorting protein
MKKIFIFMLGFIFSLSVYADEKGDQIATKHFALKEAGDSVNTATMTLFDKNGNKKTRKIKMYSKKTGEGTNSFIEFLEPADVRGSKFLTIAHDKGDDEQRLFLPALGKVRRISASGKKGDFMGSDLSYYDMESRTVNDAAYKYVKDETYNGMDCFVLEATPKDKDAPYSKNLIWVNKTDYFMYKTDCYDDKKGEFFKTIEIKEVKVIDGVIIPAKIEVNNIRDNHKTILQMEDIKVNSGVKDEIFSIQNLN